MAAPSRQVGRCQISGPATAINVLQFRILPEKHLDYLEVTSRSGRTDRLRRTSIGGSALVEQEHHYLRPTEESCRHQDRPPDEAAARETRMPKGNDRIRVEVLGRDPAQPLDVAGRHECGERLRRGMPRRREAGDFLALPPSGRRCPGRPPWRAGTRVLAQIELGGNRTVETGQPSVAENVGIAGGPVIEVEDKQSASMFVRREDDIVGRAPSLTRRCRCRPSRKICS